MIYSTVQVATLVFASVVLIALVAIAVVWDDARRDGRANVEAFRAGYSEGMQQSAGPPLWDDPPAAEADGPAEQITDDIPVLPSHGPGPAELAGTLTMIQERLADTRADIAAIEDDISFAAETALRGSQPP